MRLKKSSYRNNREIKRSKFKSYPKIKKKILLVTLILILLIGGALAYEVFRKKDIVLTTCIAAMTEDLNFCTRKDCDNTTNKEPCTERKCVNELYFLQALRNSRSGDTSLCDRMIEEWPNGYDRITCAAIVKDDISVCSEHTDEIHKVECEAVLSRDISHCDVFEGATDYEGIMADLDCRETYYTYLAYLNNDDSYCEGIKKIARMPVVNSKIINEGINYTHSYYACKGVVTRQLRWCGGGHICFGDKEDLLRCYEISHYRDNTDKREKEIYRNLIERSAANPTLIDKFKLWVTYRRYILEEENRFRKLEGEIRKA